ncbi:DUF2946 family protein [Sapientia aquatica]|uniref:DUF2946 domain-containing protein n=1 Tax=Sapientia aquatica TaxID=1549640 RepID=A0A4R5W6B7_9BURK|nr:DUF2946 domain-containing protein [Sapientia aquatica]
MFPSTFHSSRKAIVFRWFAIWVMLCLLGQSLLPSFAFAQADSNPRLWDEICSVYGARSTTADKSHDADSKLPAPTHHAECPLCLHVFNDVTLSTPTAIPSFHLVLLQQLGYQAPQLASAIQPISSAQARAPPFLI